MRTSHRLPPIRASSAHERRFVFVSFALPANDAPGRLRFAGEALDPRQPNSCSGKA